MQKVNSFLLSVIEFNIWTMNHGEAGLLSKIISLYSPMRYKTYPLLVPVRIKP
ncbi:MAG: hypothetical protein AB8G15_22355 [Saprospiraceae bacterium]